MGGTLLLFGYDQLPVILAAEAAVKPFGATLQVVDPRSCGLTLGQLAAGVSAPPDAAPVALGGQMAVLCGLDRHVDALIPALQKAGVLCPKAVLTETNRSWTPPALLAELHRERAALERRR